jgi:dihydrolipoamide dehydrogenase
MKEFDVVVIGGGPGGYVAAIRSSQLGMKVAIIEREHMGGICLNWGCIPTKALLKSAEILRKTKHSDEYGIITKDVKIDFDKIISRSRDVSKKLSGGISMLMNKNNIEVINGSAKLIDKNKIEIFEFNKEDRQPGSSKEVINVKNIIIATGARARELSGFESDGNLVWNYRHAMVAKKIPKSLLIIGSGAIGIEFASFYKEMGSDVTVIEISDKILPAEDEEISSLALKMFKDYGIKFHTKVKINKLNKNKDSVSLLISEDNKDIELSADRIIMATGIVPNTENIGLENIGIKINDGKNITVNQYCQTNISNIFAIGDVNSVRPWLAHKASHEGIIVADYINHLRNIKNKKPHPLNPLNVPGCTYSYPQIASIGLTEAKAKEQKINIKVGRFSYIGNGKAIANGDGDGMIKTIFNAKTGEILGAHIIGENATEIIHSYVVGKTAELTEEDFMSTVFAHPTLSEMIPESVMDAYGIAIHK